MDEKELKTSGNPENKSVNVPVKDEKLAAEIEKIRKKQVFLKIVTIILSAAIVVSFLIFYFLYKKFYEMKPFLDAVQGIQNGGANSFSGQNLPALSGGGSQNGQYYVDNPSYSTAPMTSNSLSSVGFSELSEGGDNASAEQKKEEVREALGEYTQSDAMKNMMEELKKDPELKAMFDNAGDPSKAGKIMNKMHDPKIMNKVLSKMMSRPDFLPLMMKMISDPKVRQAMQKNGLNPSDMMKSPPSAPSQSPAKNETGK